MRGCWRADSPAAEDVSFVLPAEVTGCVGIVAVQPVDLLGKSALRAVCGWAQESVRPQHRKTRTVFDRGVCQRVFAPILTMIERLFWPTFRGALRELRLILSMRPKVESVFVRPLSTSAQFPTCAVSSKRMHIHYGRMRAPCRCDTLKPAQSPYPASPTLNLRQQVRHLICANIDCNMATFSEQIEGRPVDAWGARRCRAKSREGCTFVGRTRCGQCRITVVVWITVLPFK